MKHTVELVELKNGAKGLLIIVPDASVTSFDFNFRAGDYLAPIDKWDTAHIMEHMVLGANKRYASSSEFSKVFEQNGAYSNASTGTYHMSYIAECADFETERILDLLCLSIEAPAFLESEFKAEKANVREELKSRRNNHSSELALTMSAKMGEHDLPYTERAKLLDNISLEDVVAHYKKTHTSQNLRFMIAGNIGSLKQAIIDRIESMPLPKGNGRIALPTEKLVSLDTPVVMRKQDVENVYYRYEVVLGKLLTPEEIDGLTALEHVLLGSMHSRVFGKAREQGLAYGINYGDYRTKDSAIFWIAGQVLQENAQQLFELFAHELKDIAAGNVSGSELEAVKLAALGSFKRTTQTVGQLLDGYSSWFIYDDKIEDYYATPERIKAVTLERVIAAAQSIVAKPAYGVGFAGHTAGLKTAELAEVLTA